MALNSLNISAFKTGAGFSIATGIILIVFSFLGGKEDLFLLLNHNLGATADFFFQYFTHAGDGIFWVPLALYFIFYKRRLLPLILSAIMLSTLLVQTGKKIIYPNEARPTAAIDFWVIGFTAALLAGYSRVYLAQHFPLDVGAGIICAVITVYLSLQIQKAFDKQWKA